MGLDLAVLPNPYGGAFPANMWGGFSRIGFQRDYLLFERIRELPAEPLPEGHLVDDYGDEGLEQTDKDNYGDRLQVVKAGEFKKIQVESIPDLSAWNLAAIAFLTHLPLEAPVILYWR